MKLPFLNREQELRRLRRFARRSEAALAVLYGRRRCGKSRLLLESLPQDKLVYYVADAREPTVQRAALAREMARQLPGFDRVVYPDWETLLLRWWEDSPRTSVLVLDEFPALVAQDPALPSLLQKLIDSRKGRLVLCGSSQRMMHGLVMDRTAPLFGRAVEILKVEPLTAGWIRDALTFPDEGAATPRCRLPSKAT